MQYHFKEIQFGVTHRELCNYNNYNRRITIHIPGWRKGKGSIHITGNHIIPETFLHVFTDIGNIRASKLPPIPEPKPLLTSPKGRDREAPSNSPGGGE